MDAEGGVPLQQAMPSGLADPNALLQLIHQQGAQFNAAMLQMQQQIQQVLQIAVGGQQGAQAHVARASVDERCFRRLDKFSNKEKIGGNGGCTFLRP